MISRMLRSRYEFFRQHAGYIVGENAKGALNLARAEAWAWEENLVPVWRYEIDEGWVCCLCEPDDPMSFDPEPGETLAACGGIETDGDVLRRVIQGELASEAMRSRA
jgi:hypothetical protein